MNCFKRTIAKIDFVSDNTENQTAKTNLRSCTQKMTSVLSYIFDVKLFSGKCSQFVAFCSSDASRKPLFNDKRMHIDIKTNNEACF